jgi:hypothetical protein
MTREKLTYQIKKTVREIEQIVTEMIAVSQMIGGSFGSTYRKCGKANCWCSEKHQKGHPCLRITYTENRTSRTKAIPKEDKEWIKERTDTYRNFRKNFQKLRQREKKLHELLNQFEKEVKTNTSQLKPYL